MNVQAIILVPSRAKILGNFHVNLFYTVHMWHIHVYPMHLWNLCYLQRFKVSMKDNLFDPFLLLTLKYLANDGHL
jgi:hypothetical protein